MKPKIYLLGGLALALLFAFNSCKPKESAYKAAYEAAKAKETTTSQVEETTTPVTRPVSTTEPASVQREKVTIVDGAVLQQYSVVIGSFLDVTNAKSLKERMVNQGFQSVLAQNEKGMYRVIIATFNNKASAAAERDRFKEKYYPNFQDTWILDKQ